MTNTQRDNHNIIPCACYPQFSICWLIRGEKSVIINPRYYPISLHPQVFRICISCWLITKPLIWIDIRYHRNRISMGADKLLYFAVHPTKPPAPLILLWYLYKFPNTIMLQTAPSLVSLAQHFFLFLTCSHRWCFSPFIHNMFLTVRCVRNIVRCSVVISLCLFVSYWQPPPPRVLSTGDVSKYSSSSSSGILSSNI